MSEKIFLQLHEKNMTKEILVATEINHNNLQISSNTKSTGKKVLFFFPKKNNILMVETFLNRIKFF